MTSVLDAHATEIERLHASGHSQAEIGRMFGVSQPCIGRLMSRRGMPTRRPAIPVEREPEVRRLCAEGRSQREIARMLGVSQDTVARLMLQLGIAAGSRGGYRGQKAGPVGYTACHNRVRARRGTPQRCDVCGTTDPGKRYDWANLAGDYLNPDDFARMCRPCHKLYDLARQRGPGYLSIVEAADRTGVPRATLNNHARRGLIAAQKVNGGVTSTYRITEEAVAAYLARRTA